jgi:enterobactin synthetase component D
MEPDEECRAIEALLRAWLPQRAFVQAAPIGDHPMHPAEAALIAGAVPRRQHEFAAGRWLMRRGLVQLGFPDQAILASETRVPILPQGVRGAISHDAGLCAVALMLGGEGLGLDLVARNRRNRWDDLAPMFMTDDGEADAIAELGLPADPLMILFSFKESMIKAMAPHRAIGLRDIALTWKDGLAVLVQGERRQVALHAGLTPSCVVTAVTLLS